ncbi:MAG: acyltransferase family protein [Candidatus Cryptobacteroides sp.]
METRDLSLDSVKFALIVLVVIGHSIEPSRYINDVSSLLYSIIYLFHMPLFAFLSGYFTKENNLEKINKGSLKLLETYLVLVVFYVLFLGQGKSSIIFPPGSSWYLFSLILWRYFIYFAKNYAGISVLVAVAVSILLSILFFLLPLGKIETVFAISKTIQFFPFFIIGNYLRKWDISSLCRGYEKQFIVLSIIVILTLCWLIPYSRAIHLTSFRRSNLFSIQQETSLGLIVLCLLKLFVESATIILSGAAICCFSRLKDTIGRLGRYSIVIYVVQAFCVTFVWTALPDILWIEMLFAAVVILAGVIISVMGIGKYLTNPVTTIIDRFSHVSV